MNKLLSVVLLTGCGSLPIIEEIPLNTEIAPELQPYVDDFMLSCKFEGTEDTCLKNIKRIKAIKLANAEDLEAAPSGRKPAGVCEITSYLGGSHNGIIYIQKEYFEGLENLEIAKKSLLFHELGHCLINMDHIDDRPHIMNSQHFVVFGEYAWREAVKDMFNSARAGEAKKIFSMTVNGECGVRNE